MSSNCIFTELFHCGILLTFVMTAYEWAETLNKIMYSIFVTMLSAIRISSNSVHRLSNVLLLHHWHSFADVRNSTIRIIFIAFSSIVILPVWKKMAESEDMTPATSEESIAVPDPSGRRKCKPSYQNMIRCAILALKSKSGSSRKSIIRYILSHNTVKKQNCARCVGRAIKCMRRSGMIYVTKRGQYKLTLKGRGIRDKGRKRRRGGRKGKRRGRRTRRRKGRKSRKGKKKRKKGRKGKKRRRKGRKGRKGRRRTRKRPVSRRRRRGGRRRKGRRGVKRRR